MSSTKTTCVYYTAGWTLRFQAEDVAVRAPEMPSLHGKKSFRKSDVVVFLRGVLIGVVYTIAERKSPQNPHVSSIP